MTEQPSNEKIIHDIRNQLSGITTASSLFLDGLLGELTDEQKKHVGTIKSAAEKIVLLLQQINR